MFAKYPWLLPLLLTVVSLVSVFLLPLIFKLPALTKKGFDWIDAHLKLISNQFVSGLLLRLSAIVRAVVLKIENDEIEVLKQNVVDGKVPADKIPETLKQIEQKAIEDVKKLASLQGLWNLIVNVGFNGNEAGLFSWTQNEVRSSVSQLPPSGLQTGALQAGVPQSAVEIAKTKAASSQKAATP